MGILCFGAVCCRTASFFWSYSLDFLFHRRPMLPISVGALTIFLSSVPVWISNLQITLIIACWKQVLPLYLQSPRITLHSVQRHGLGHQHISFGVDGDTKNCEPVGWGCPQSYFPTVGKASIIISTTFCLGFVFKSAEKDLKTLNHIAQHLSYIIFPYWHKREFSLGPFRLVTFFFLESRATCGECALAFKAVFQLYTNPVGQSTHTLHQPAVKFLGPLQRRFNVNLRVENWPSTDKRVEKVCQQVPAQGPSRFLQAQWKNSCYERSFTVPTQCLLGRSGTKFQLAEVQIDQESCTREVLHKVLVEER